MEEEVDAESVHLGQDKNRKGGEAEGFTNLPAWLSPDLETEKRAAGSGFGRFAVWTEVSGATPKSEPIAAPESETVATIAPSSFASAIERARNGLAAELGISAAVIDIVFRGGAGATGA
jgi:hypothetical protein